MELSLEQIKKDLKQIRREKNRKVEFRLFVLGGVETNKRKRRFLIDSGVSERTYYRWKKSYLKLGIDGLRDKKGRGRKKNHIRGKLASKIKYMRKEYEWGAEVICAHLEANISQYKVNRYLKDKGFIVKPKRKNRSKHTKKVVVTTPGEFTQVDVKHLTELHRSRRAYAYNFVDHASKWSFKMVFDSYGPYETGKFMNEVIRRAPFKILKTQTDNGVEFTNKFISDPINPKEHRMDTICNQNGIKHKLIPVGEKELNGLVEKHHHIDWKEFYRKQKGYDLELINKRLEKHCKWRNQNRRFKPLNWQTPNEYIREYEKFKLKSKLLESYAEMEFRQAA